VKPRLMGLLIFVFATGTGLAGPDRWIHVRVIDGGEKGESVFVNLPLDLAEKVLPTIQAENLRNGKVKVEGKFEGVDVRALMDAIRTAGDNEFVTVKGPDEQVRVAKSGAYLLIKVRDGEHASTKVDVKVPITVADALLSGGNDELDVVAAIRALRTTGDVELVTVEDGASRVRIWVDSKSASE
jgi:hypothetical protein